MEISFIASNLSEISKQCTMNSIEKNNLIEREITCVILSKFPKLHLVRSIAYMDFNGF